MNVEKYMSKRDACEIKLLFLLLSPEINFKFVFLFFIEDFMPFLEKFRKILREKILKRHV